MISQYNKYLLTFFSTIIISLTILFTFVSCRENGNPEMPAGKLHIYFEYIEAVDDLNQLLSQTSIYVCTINNAGAFISINNNDIKNNQYVIELPIGEYDIVAEYRNRESSYEVGLSRCIIKSNHTTDQKLKIDYNNIIEKE